MNGEHLQKNVLLIALGGSGRKTAVVLSEKISQARQEMDNGAQVNLKVVSIDFPTVQSNGYLVKPEEHLSILGYGTNITECWQDLQEEMKLIPEEEQEPWMNVGPISESELWLAQDAQQSGIRRVDYFLLIHQARKLIEKKIREALSTFDQDGNANSEITLIILGSLAGRTGSISYIPTLKILNALVNEFKFASSFSFLYTPQAFEMNIHVENELNFFESLSRIRRYFKTESVRNFNLAQILVDEPDPILTSSRDGGRPAPYSEIIERIENLIELPVNEASSSGSYEEWLGSIKRIDISEIDSMAESNKQINKYRDNNPFAISQSWSTNSLEQVFANLVKNT